MALCKEVVIVTLSMGNGGAERVFSELANCWDNKSIKVTIIRTRPNFEGDDNYALNSNIQIIDMVFPKGHFRRTKQAIDLIKILKQKPNAVVIAILEQPILLTAIASFFVKNKIIFTERNDPGRNLSRKNRLGRNIIFELADTCVFQTIEAKNYFSKRIQNRSFVISNPINPLLPSPYTGKRRKVVFAAARLAKQKNLKLLIDSFDLFHKTHPDYNLEIYGRGPLENELNDYISNKELNASAKLMGFSEDIYSKMRDVAIYASSSDYEGQSNSMLEALGMGVPTICTEVNGTRNVIKNGINALLVPVGDVQGFYEAMCKIADDKEFSESISKNAVKIRQELSVDKIAKQWLEVMKIDF